MAAPLLPPGTDGWLVESWEKGLRGWGQVDTCSSPHPSKPQEGASITFLHTQETELLGLESVCQQQFPRLGSPKEVSSKRNLGMKLTTQQAWAPRLLRRFWGAQPGLVLLLPHPSGPHYFNINTPKTRTGHPPPYLYPRTLS